MVPPCTATNTVYPVHPSCSLLTSSSNSSTRKPRFFGYCTPCVTPRGVLQSCKKSQCACFEAPHPPFDIRYGYCIPRWFWQCDISPMVPDLLLHTAGWSGYLLTSTPREHLPLDALQHAMSLYIYFLSLVSIFNRFGLLKSFCFCT